MNILTQLNNKFNIKNINFSLQRNKTIIQMHFNMPRALLETKSPSYTNN